MKAAAFLSAILFCVACVGTARASGTLNEFKDNGQELGGHTFTITSKPLPTGAVQFHVVISDRTGEFDPRFDHASLGIVTIIRNVSESVSDRRKLPLEKRDHSLACDFTVEKEDIGNPDFCFIYTRTSRDRMPGVDFIFARLKNFSAADRQATPGPRR
jgi:hypothetical protein